MELRYLFKGKRIDNGEWVEGYLFCYREKSYILWGMINNTPAMVEVDSDTVCQCTGAYDENGKLIYEKDVVSYLDKDRTESGYAEVACIGEVAWGACTFSFWVTNTISAESYEVLDEGCKVIGNVFDNPELVEV